MPLRPNLSVRGDQTNDPVTQPNEAAETAKAATWTGKPAS